MFSSFFIVLRCFARIISPIFLARRARFIIAVKRRRPPAKIFPKYFVTEIESAASFILMNENDSQKIFEKQIDKFAQSVLRSTILTDEEVKEIADSPRLWRQLHSRIADERSRRENRWFFGWRWQALASGALAILIAAFAAFWLFDSPKKETANVPSEKIINAEDETTPVERTSETQPSIVPPAVQPEKRSVKTGKLLSKTSPKVKAVRVQPAPQRPSKVKNLPSQKNEISTEFIALTYLPATESGQIVRVKVPRSMLVSLGVTTNVEKNSELVNAEVILGDDGAARAIRFLGQ